MQPNFHLTRSKLLLIFTVIFVIHLNFNPINGSPMTIKGNSVGQLYKEGKALEKDKKYEKALEVYNKALFLSPETKALASKVYKLKVKLASTEVKKATTALKAGDESLAKSHLFKAIDYHPKYTKAHTHLKKLDYRFFLGYWRTKAELKSIKAKEKTLEDKARSALIIDDEYRFKRTPHFRVFTNMEKSRNMDKWLAPVLKVLESTYERFTWTFSPVPPSKTAAKNGLNVIIFKDEDSYRKYLRQRKIQFSFRTAGFYDPQKECSFFYRKPNYSDLLPTLIHEITHQLCHELLNAVYPTWISEGIAQYFEGAIVKKDYTIEIGRPERSSLEEFKKNKMLTDLFVPSSKFFRVTNIGDRTSYDGRTVHQAYSFAWAWAYFFLHNEAEHREILLKCIKKESQMGWTGQNHQLYIDTISSWRDLEELDAEFKIFIRSLNYSGKKGK